MAANVVRDTDPAANIKPTKVKSMDKIDGAAAAIMGLGRAVRNEGDPGSICDEREMIIF